ncbi:DUF397 domain-containing protein [Haloechinothrix sp. LS1_15]|uniref:DUF397 domain-containing protein n=1 Tax=Haloechinothrix sp. LS1_15 TaxID=2652248 RepID=UPI002947C6E7|nr:DUF397 domain-containing protein [Haloechinothrix sp. LS1_15]MDV6011829.1 DUF397 domain-containing protein [Haloechinothrix sp. LS1_15]
MSTPELAQARWRRSSRTNNGGGNCVELALLPGGTAVRDSKDRAGGTLTVPPSAWRAFHSAVVAGRVDT